MLLPLLLLLQLPLKIDSANDPCDLEVKFSSKNFKNILTWSTPSQKGVLYNVMYKTYGHDTWWEKAECTNISHNWCDLTNETSPPSEQYFGKVLINNQGCKISKLTDRFNPLLDTVLDPPKVNLFLTSTSVTINLTHVVGDLSTIYDTEILYELEIPGQSSIISEEPYYEIKILDLQTNFCVSAKLRGTVKSNFSNYTCIRIKTDNTSEEKIHIMLYILSASLVIFVVFGAGYSVHKYIYVVNLEKPKILNITSKYHNIVLVDAHKVTINVIKIESNEKSTMMADKEEATQVKTDLYFKDDGYKCDTRDDSLVTEDDDHGYINLLVHPPATRPQVSPYDMPHDPESKTSMASTITLNKEEDLYGRIKCNTIIASIEKKTTEEVYQKSNVLEEPFTYLPKNDQNLIEPDLANNELSEREESTLAQAADNIVGTDGTDFSDCDTLFVDWSPTSHHLYIPNFHSKPVDEVVAEESEEVEGLLAHLYKPIQIEENSEELTCLEQKWELHVKMQE